MRTTRLQAAADRRARASRLELAEQLRRLVDDAGVTQRQLSTASGLAQPYVGRILAGSASPTLEAYQRLASALGADLSTRLYPNTGPAIRDRLAAPMLELLLAETHPRFARYTEVGVRRPSRGWIDAVLHEPREGVAIASELQSELRRLEQLIRWQAAKAESLPSWEGWPHLGEEPAISRLLLVRRSRATRVVAQEYARQLRVAYPAHPDDALAALTGTVPWPGPALVWVTVDAKGARFAAGR
jgi:transcriptional regulator with XRE-family HTH domain